MRRRRPPVVMPRVRPRRHRPWSAAAPVEGSARRIITGGIITGSIITGGIITGDIITTAPSLRHHHGTITTSPQRHRHHIITTPSLHHHYTITTPSLLKHRHRHRHYRPHWPITTRLRRRHLDADEVEQVDEHRRLDLEVEGRLGAQRWVE
eukprot:7031974-Prymnesium_polylepis.1